MSPIIDYYYYYYIFLPTNADIYLIGTKIHGIYLKIKKPRIELKYYI